MALEFTNIINVEIFEKYNYSCGLMSVCESVCLSIRDSVCQCIRVHNNSKNNSSIRLKLEHVVVFENS